ncbi:MAG: c-type cytochrome [Candidatus Omnitrophica bacterium]|nr:c-type cytochrome [Candidatus Omnitrophota bacterium]
MCLSSSIRWVIGLGIVGFLGSPTPAFSDADLAAGKDAYEANCARCHGPTGAGDGPDAKRMFPKPRKLAEGIFKFRTTASGTPPTDEDLFRTLSTGLPGSRMPDFQRLSEETRRNLIAYVKSLSPIFKDQAPEPIDLGKDPGPKEASLAKGKEVYAQLGCASCHGTAGRGNGPSAPTLVDSWGSPIRAANLTQGWNYRAGSGVKEIVARMMAGIDGTPMPSYADALSSKEDAWHLAYYVHSLQETPHWNRTIEAVKAAGSLPADPEDPKWQEAPRTDLRLSSTVYQQGEIQPTSVNAIGVQAVYNEDAVLFRLTWQDPNESREDPPDAVRLFLLQDRRLKFQVGSLRSWPAGPDAPALDVCSWSAKQDSAREAEQMLESNDSEITSGAASSSRSQDSYADGVWTLLIKRPLKSFHPGGVTLSTKKPFLFGAVVFDGGNGERDRRRANSNWVDLVLK